MGWLSWTASCRGPGRSGADELKPFSDCQAGIGNYPAQAGNSKRLSLKVPARRTPNFP